MSETATGTPVSSSEAQPDLDVWVSQHGDELRRHLAGMLGTEADAEDVLQEAWIAENLGPQAQLKTALEERGPAHAIQICGDRAPAIAAELALEGLTIRRIGTRVRNAATNAPTAAEREVLDRFAALPEDRRAGATVPHVRAAGRGEDDVARGRARRDLAARPSGVKISRCMKSR